MLLYIYAYTLKDIYSYIHKTLVYICTHTYISMEKNIYLCIVINTVLHATQKKIFILMRGYISEESSGSYKLCYS